MSINSIGNIEQEVEKCIKKGILPINFRARKIIHVLKTEFKYTDELLINHIIRTGNKTGVWRRFVEEDLGVSFETYVAKNILWLLLDLLRSLNQDEFEENNDVVCYQSDMPEWFNVEEYADRTPDALDRVISNELFKEALSVFGDKDILAAATGEKTVFEVAKKHSHNYKYLCRKVNNLKKILKKKVDFSC